MPESLEWGAESAACIQSRSQRYAGALDIHPDWTLEALQDPDLVAFESDPKSRMGASRFIGDSSAAGAVLVVIAYRDLDGDLHGINAWPASGADLRAYEGDIADGEEA